jgi:O-antigen/teichoic acid export membrane protein
MLFSFLSLPRMRSWFLKGGIAVLDQGIFSGSNFVLNILFARWLRPEEYGAFAISFAIYLFASGFQNALVLEPMTLFGPAKYPDILKEYLAGQTFIHFIVTGLLGLITLVTGIVLYSFQLVDDVLSSSITAAGVFLPFMLSIWLARRSCYVLEKPIWALASSTLYAIALFSTAFYIYQQKLLASPFYWFLILGISSLLGWLLIYLNPRLIVFKAIKWWIWIKDQWSFGKWIVLAAFLNFAGTQVQLFIVAAQLGLDQAGVFRALQNFMLPMTQILTAITTLVLPSISVDFGRRNYFSMRNKAKKITFVLTLIAFVYAITLIAFARPAEMFLYNGKFAKYSLMISFAGLIPLVAAIETGFSLVVRALQRPIYYVILTGTIALVGLVFSPLFVSLGDLTGALLSLMLVASVSLTVNVWLYRKWFVPQAGIETIL